MFRKNAKSTNEACCDIQASPQSARAEEACSDGACSVTPDKEDRTHCPISGTVGLKVELVTLKALLNGNALRRLDGNSYLFCPAPNCDVVYFDNSADSIFAKSDLTVRVGQKEKEDPVPLCYCFNFTLEDIRKDIMGTGETQIPGFITSEVKAGHCACEVKNPDGRCCLGSIAKALKSVAAKVVTVREQSPLPGGP